MRDYTRYSFILTVIVLAGLVALAFVPSFSVAGAKFKRANIFSDLYSFGDETLAAGDAELTRDDLDFVREMQDQAEYATEGPQADTTATAQPGVAPPPAGQEWDLGSTANTNSGSNASGAEPVSLENITFIEDYSPDGSIHRFAALLGTASRSRNVRIAFLGDSFIEGDIITADVREQLQDSYGGQGVGFVPMSSITAEYRPTVKHTFRGWKDYLLANKKTTPEQLRERFYVSGIISAANGAAWSQYETTTYRKHIGEVSSVRFFYGATEPADITLKINDTHEKTFTADTTATVSRIDISGGGIKKVRVSVPASDGFAAYGVSLEGPSGVLVDNYSIRSSTGLSLFGTSTGVNTAFNRMLGYDLVVLQYGLNIMSADVTGYKSYGEQFRNLIRYIQRCFPGAAVIVMGVGDRSMLSNGQFVTMPAVPAMVKEQRSAAEECGVGFWNTYQAMGGYNSMRKFAEWGWAAKDYTHLSFGGGRKIATELVKAIEYARLNRWYPDGAEPIVDGDTLEVIPPVFYPHPDTTANNPMDYTPLQPIDTAEEWNFDQPEEPTEAPDSTTTATDTPQSEPTALPDSIPAAGTEERNTQEPDTEEPQPDIPATESEEALPAEQTPDDHGDE